MHSFFSTRCAVVNGFSHLFDSFHAPLDAALSHRSQIINGYFIIDISLQFFLPYKDAKGILKKSKKRIARKYLTTWFAIDVISVLPIDVLVVANALQASRGSPSLPSHTD